MTLHTTNNTIAIIIDGKKIMNSLSESPELELYNHFEDTNNFIPDRRILFESANDEVNSLEKLFTKPSNANHQIRGGLTIEDVEEFGKKILELVHLSPFFIK